MVEDLLQLNHFIATFGLVCIAAIIVLLLDLLTKQKLAMYVARWGMIVAFFSVLIASGLTLLYSEGFGIVPCGLCWFERIMLYPQLFLVGGALYFKDLIMPKHGIVLSAVGLVISLYHHYIQMGGSQFVKCPAAGADCAKRFLFEFDFMTFPLLAAILFAFLIVLYTYMLRAPKSATA